MVTRGFIGVYLDVLLVLQIFLLRTAFLLFFDCRGGVIIN